MVSKENLLFAGTLALVVAVLASFMVYFGTSNPDEPQQTDVNKNNYLITPQVETPATKPATRAAASTLPAPVSAESASPSAPHTYKGGSSGSGFSGGHGGGHR